MTPDNTTAIYEKVKTQFSKTAAAYVGSRIHAKGDDLKRLVTLSGVERGDRVLDVATGGGHTALAFARAGAEVTASDLTPDMLAAAKTHICSQGHTNLEYVVAPAENLPFKPGRFDLVTCRIAPHHFADPAAFVQEVARVLVPGGQFLLVDNVTPQSTALANTVNHIEKTRDPSHVEAYSVKTWLDWLLAAGLEPFHLERFRRTKTYADWIAYAQAETVHQTLEAWILALPAETKRYLEVEVEKGKLVSLSHEVVLIKACKF